MLNNRIIDFCPRSKQQKLSVHTHKRRVLSALGHCFFRRAERRNHDGSERFSTGVDCYYYYHLGPEKRHRRQHRIISRGFVREINCFFLSDANKKSLCELHNSRVAAKLYCAAPGIKMFFVAKSGECIRSGKA